MLKKIKQSAIALKNLVTDFYKTSVRVLKSIWQKKPIQDHPMSQRISNIVQTLDIEPDQKDFTPGQMNYILDSMFQDLFDNLGDLPPNII